MNIASILLTTAMFAQRGPCGSTGPRPPCCDRPNPCGGGPPPPPGLDIDMFVYVLFFIALIYGAYRIQKLNKQKLAV